MENNAIISFILKLSLKIIYFPLKLFRTKQQVVMISREFNEPPVDFVLLQQDIAENNPQIKVVFLCKTMGNSVKDFVLYWFFLVKCCYYLATSFSCVVDTYCIPVSVLKHKRNLKIVQIWHALGALKRFGYQTLGKAEGSSEKVAKRMCMHKNYSLVTCASQKTKEFYLKAFNVEPEKVKVLGMPRIDLILKPEPKLKANFLNKYPNFTGKKIILYVPTFRKGLPVNYKPLTNINFNDFALVVKPHVLSESTVESKYLTEGFSTFELLKIADYIITDYSAISFEASLLNKPLYFYLYDINSYSENRGLNIDITEEMSSACFTNADDLLNNIKTNAYNFDQLESFRKTYIETYDLNNSKRIVDYILN